MNQQKNIILKTIAITMVLFIIVIPSVPSHDYHKVQAASFTEDMNTLAVVAMLMIGLTTTQTISAQQSLTPANLSAIREKINASGETVKTGVNALGQAILTGADKAKIQALTSGALIYGVLKAMQDVLYPNQVVTTGTIASFGMKYVCTAGNYSYYIATDALTDDSFANFTIDGTSLIFNSSLLKYGYAPGQGRAQLIVNCYENGESDYYKYTNTYSDNLHVNDTTRVFFYEGYGTRAIAAALAGQSYFEKASKISSLPSISIPKNIPTTIINNINNYDGISDVVLGLPEGTTYSGEDFLTVDPTTIPIDDPDVPIDPPVEETSILSTILAALAGLLPISLNRDDATKSASQDLYLPGIDSLIKTISDNADAFGNDITSAIDTVIALPATINDFFAIPDSMTIFSPLKISLSNKVPIIGQLQTGFQTMFNGDTRPLIINYPAFGEERQINLNWYEPIRLQVRGGLGLIFRIALALAIFGMVSSIFNINGIGRASGQIERGASRGKE